MRIAILSDIHGNWTALQAVLARLERLRVDLICGVGDYLWTTTGDAAVVGWRFGGLGPGFCLNLLVEIPWRGISVAAGTENHHFFIQHWRRRAQKTGDSIDWAPKDWHFASTCQKKYPGGVYRQLSGRENHQFFTKIRRRRVQKTGDSSGLTVGTCTGLGEGPRAAPELGWATWQTAHTPQFR